jgi:hypothetical protein
MAVDDREDQRRSASVVGRVQRRLKRRALRQQAFELREASGAGGLLQRGFRVAGGFLFLQLVRGRTFDAARAESAEKKNRGVTASSKRKEVEPGLT